MTDDLDSDTAHAPASEGATLYWRGRVEVFASDIGAVLWRCQRHALALLLLRDAGESAVYWRGSVSDLVTDLRALLTVEQQFELGRQVLLPSGALYVGPSSEERARAAPVPMLLYCPECGSRHIDEGEFATKPHHTHACQGCGAVWRPAILDTVGVQFLPGFRNEEAISK